MNDPTQLSAEIAVALSIVGIMISAGGLAVSIRSSSFARSALAISERNEARRQPQIHVYLARSYAQAKPGGQVCLFLVFLSNPTDINNALARAELRVAFLRAHRGETTYRFPHRPELAENAPTGSISGNGVLTLPTRIDAHQTVAGWLLFKIEDAISESRSIESYEILLEDSHGAVTAEEIVTIGKWVDETEPL